MPSGGLKVLAEAHRLPCMDFLTCQEPNDALSIAQPLQKKNASFRKHDTPLFNYPKTSALYKENYFITFVEDTSSLFSLTVSSLAHLLFCKYQPLLIFGPYGRSSPLESTVFFLLHHKSQPQCNYTLTSHTPFWLSQPPRKMPLPVRRQPTTTSPHPRYVILTLLYPFRYHP